jgi:hypothetical protein
MSFNAIARRSAANRLALLQPDKTDRREKLISDLAMRGIKHSPGNILEIGRTKSGKIVFLEKGNSAAGLKHILMRHEQDFVKAGYHPNQIPSVVMRAVVEGAIVGHSGDRPIYEFVHEGKSRHIAVTVSDNGFVVGANPISSSWKAN